MSNKWKIFWVASFAFVVLFQACGMHSWEEMIVSKEDEKKMGKDFDNLVKAGSRDVLEADESLFSPNGAAQQEFYDYYQAKAKEILNSIEQKDWEGILPSGYTKNNFFEFKIIKSKQVNAFAVPGGYVYFYTSILKQFQSESELMGVLGHEVGHVVLHHTRDRIVKQVGASVIIDALLGDGMGALIASLGTSVWLTNNGQGDELASDSMGFYFTNKIGISSEGLGEFFARGMESYNPSTGECNEKKESSIFDFASTHPPSCKRVNENKRRMKAVNQNLPKERGYNGKEYKQLVTEAAL
jgi:predicted Zn-dependent protease